MSFFPGFSSLYSGLLVTNTGKHSEIEIGGGGGHNINCLGYDVLNTTNI